MKSKTLGFFVSLIILFLTGCSSLSVAVQTTSTPTLVPTITNTTQPTLTNTPTPEPTPTVLTYRLKDLSRLYDNPAFDSTYTANLPAGMKVILLDKEPITKPDLAGWNWYHVQYRDFVGYIAVSTPEYEASLSESCHTILYKPMKTTIGNGFNFRRGYSYSLGEVKTETINGIETDMVKMVAIFKEFNDRPSIANVYWQKLGEVYKNSSSGYVTNLTFWQDCAYANGIPSRLNNPDGLRDSGRCGADNVSKTTGEGLTGGALATSNWRWYRPELLKAYSDGYYVVYNAFNSNYQGSEIYSADKNKVVPELINSESNYPLYKTEADYENSNGWQYNNFLQNKDYPSDWVNMFWEPMRQMSIDDLHDAEIPIEKVRACLNYYADTPTEEPDIYNLYSPLTNIMMHEEPNMDSKIVQLVSAYTPTTLIDYNPTKDDSGNYFWWHVKLNDTTSGYIPEVTEAGRATQKGTCVDKIQTAMKESTSRFWGEPVGVNVSTFTDESTDDMVGVSGYAIALGEIKSEDIHGMNVDMVKTLSLYNDPYTGLVAARTYWQGLTNLIDINFAKCYYVADSFCPIDHNYELQNKGLIKNLGGNNYEINYDGFTQAYKDNYFFISFGTSSTNDETGRFFVNPPRINRESAELPFGVDKEEQDGWQIDQFLTGQAVSEDWVNLILSTERTESTKSITSVPVDELNACLDKYK